MLKDNHNIHHIQIDNKEVILIGTAHISHASVTLVKETIEKENPDSIAIELCPSRFKAIQGDDKWQNMNLFKVIKEGKTIMLIINLILASFQRKLAKQFNITPGAEMKQAINSAEHLDKQIILIDRDVRTTLLRVIGSMSFWAKLKFMSNGFGSFLSKEEVSQESIDQLTNGDQLISMLDSMGQNSPEIKKSIIDERDLYMVEKIRQSSGTKIIAVVGAGHVPGMKTNLTTKVSIEALEIIPPKSLLMQIIKWTIPILIIATFIGGFIFGGKEVFTELSRAWIISNAVFCALGAMLSLAHPITIITAAIVAPITSLNPMIGAGIVCGLVELFFRKPRVKEMETLLDDIETFSGWRKNRVTRVLLVVIATSIGSGIGTLVALKLFVNVL